MISEMGIFKMSLAIVTRLKNMSLKEGRLLIRFGSNINAMLKVAVDIVWQSTFLSKASISVVQQRLKRSLS